MGWRVLLLTGALMSASGCLVDRIVALCLLSGECPDACELDSECPHEDLVCFDGQCKVRCDREGGMTCDGECDRATGRCASALGDGHHCVVDADCTSGLCFELQHQTQTPLRCTRTCARTSDCDLGIACQGLDVHLCVRGSDNQTPSGEACELSTPLACQSGVCMAGTCAEMCSRQADCADFGGRCAVFVSTANSSTTAIDTRCYAPPGVTGVGLPCARNTDCGTNVCDRATGLCAELCCSEAECPGSAMTCQAYDISATHTLKICRPKPAGLGLGAFGALCSSAADCETGLCVEGASGANACTTLCCKDADCEEGTCRPAEGEFGLVARCRPN